MISRDWTVKLWIMRPASPIHVVAQASSPSMADAVKAAEGFAKLMYGGDYPTFAYRATTRKPNPAKEALS